MRLVLFSIINLIYLSNCFDFEQNCKFSCKRGERAIQNLAPSSNGCGSMGFEIDVKSMNLDRFEKCCEIHDKCYSDCKRPSQKECDSDFKTCLSKACRQMSSEKKWNKDENQQCDSTVELFSLGVQTFGCTSFKNAKKDHCKCSKTEL